MGERLNLSWLDGYVSMQKSLQDIPLIENNKVVPFVLKREERIHDCLFVCVISLVIYIRNTPVAYRRATGWLGAKAGGGFLFSVNFFVYFVPFKNPNLKSILGKNTFASDFQFAQSF